MKKLINTIIADDEPMFRNWIRMNLLELGCRIIDTASNGKEAVSMYKLHKPDVVFMDIDMPLLSGLEAMKEILALNSDANVVIVSGHNTFKNVKSALDLGAKGFIVKPYTIGKVHSILDSVLADMPPRA